MKQEQQAYGNRGDAQVVCHAAFLVSRQFRAAAASSARLTSSPIATIIAMSVIETRILMNAAAVMSSCQTSGSIENL